MPQDLTRRGRVWRWGAMAWVGLVGSMAGVAATPATHRCPAEPVRITLSDYPSGPHLIGRGDAFAEPDPGHLVRELRAVERQLGCPFVLRRLPNPRQLMGLAQGEIDIIAAVPAGVARAQGLDLPSRGDEPVDAMAVGHSPVSLLVRRERLAALAPAWQEQGHPEGVVGVPGPGLAVDHARTQGWRVQPVAAMDKGLAMLKLDRIDYLLVPVLPMLDDPALRSGAVQVLEPPVLRLAYFHAVRPAFRAQHPAFVDAFWQAVCRASLPRRSDRPSCKP